VGDFSSRGARRSMAKAKPTRGQAGISVRHGRRCNLTGRTAGGSRAPGADCVAAGGRRAPRSARTRPSRMGHGDVRRPAARRTPGARAARHRSRGKPDSG